MSADSKQYMRMLGGMELARYKSMRKRWPEYGDVLEMNGEAHVHIQSSDPKLPAHMSEWIQGDGSWSGNGVLVPRLELVCVKYDDVEDHALWGLRKDQVGYGIPGF